MIQEKGNKMNIFEQIQQAKTTESMTELLKECAMKCLLCAYFNGCKKEINLEHCHLNEYLGEEV